MFEWIANLVSNVVNFFCELIEFIFQWLFDVISDVFFNTIFFFIFTFDTVLQFVIDLVLDVICFFLNGANSLLLSLELDFSEWSQFLIVADEVYYVADTYVPLTEIGAIIALLLTLTLGVWSVRFLLKMIPTIG